PGTVVEPGLLDSKTNNYLVSLVLAPGEAGIACVDITTSEFAATQLPLERVNQELGRLKSGEIITTESADLSGIDVKAPLTRLEDYRFDLEEATETMKSHFQVATLDGYGLANRSLAVRAAGGILHYVKETQKGALEQLTHLATYSTSSFMALDGATQRNLDLFPDSRQAKDGSLLSVLDLTETAMGGRLLRRFLGQPLLELPELVRRLDAVDWFFRHTLVRGQIIRLLESMADLERLINRVRSGIINPRELVALRRSLEVVPELRDTIAEDNPVNWLQDALKPATAALSLIASAIENEPSASLSDGGVIRQGFSPDLDKLRLMSKNARDYLSNLELKEREKTGIKSLKVGFNNVFGYYIEVSKSNLPQVPPDFIRKQTLVNGERFFTPELKEYESLILNARERITELEKDIFQRVCQQVAASGEAILSIASAVASLDVFTCFAEGAVRYGYVRPELNNGNEIIIKDGRHPVVERSLAGFDFVANDTTLSVDSDQVIILTGPNMSGKSTYLKQVALITLMAQIGSFVPATKATIGLVDRIFTRIGAREDLMAGQSTFMVEMVETASILNNATARSLVILDEIGRGTSTYDGLAIARAVSEYIHNRLGARTIFATHYHEMVELARYLPRVKNYNVAVTEENGEVIFLRRIMPGGVDKSYGIHVAKLAGLPRLVLRRAREVLDDFEEDSTRTRGAIKGGRKKPVAVQLSLLAPESPLIEELKKLDVNSLTPLEAINQLYLLKKKAEET
ncbi:MAG: DNA mismatch repair protein MutS, partial [Chloroflexota bacterium]